MGAFRGKVDYNNETFKLEKRKDESLDQSDSNEFDHFCLITDFVSTNI